MNFLSYAHGNQITPKLGLDRMACLMDKLGNPEREGRFIHIAGTNGKGSVSVALSAMLLAAGYRVALFTSPNLVDIHERIRIDGKPIRQETLSRLTSLVETASGEVKAELGEWPTPFEIWTAVFFLAVKEWRCDYAVLETGLGGLSDATNIIPQNEMAVLTRIDYDHTAYLGDTLSEIAAVKCGILKANSGTGKLFSVRQAPVVEQVILAECQEKGIAPIWIDAPAPHHFEGFYEVVDFPEIGTLRLPLSGTHQIENMSLALSCAKALGLRPHAIKEGLAHTRHPGRMELLSTHPPILYDGAHNPSGIKALVTSLARYAPRTKWTLIFATMQDKDYLASIEMLAPLCERVFCTTVQNNPRALPPKELAQSLAKRGIVATPYPTLCEALFYAQNTPTLICGSLYLYADLPTQFLS